MFGINVHFLINANFPLDTFLLNTLPSDTFPSDTFPLETFPLDSFPSDTFPLDTFPLDTFPSYTSGQENNTLRVSVHARKESNQEDLKVSWQ